MSACGDCANCGGCRGSLELTEPEAVFLRLLGSVAFLPVARKAGESVPVCLEPETADFPEVSLVIQCLEKKNLISVDYDLPLKGASMERYTGYPVRGSMALTQRGQRVLELMDCQGFTGNE